MKLYSENNSYKLYQGNMLDMLDVIEEGTIDSIITDPPYELNFMSKSWDNSGIAFEKETWKKCFDVLKEGGYLLAFGGSRTFHRIACAIEDAGFEIRDTIMWLYGSGFPKSMNIGLAIDKKNGVKSIDTGIISPNARPNSTKNNTLFESGTVGKKFTIKKASNEWHGWGTCLKPSFEPIIIARKPFKGSLVDNVIKNKVGGLNIDECRVGNEKIEYYPTDLTEAHGNKFGNGAYMPKDTTKELISHEGRFPANTILTYDDTDFDEVCGAFPQSKGASSQNNYSKGSIYRGQSLNESSTKLYGYRQWYNDNGSASRYFYCAKASKKDRDEGLDSFEEIPYAVSNQAQAELRRGNLDKIKGRSQMNSVQMRKNTHPTVKPTELMQYLLRLVSPNGSTILDPFNGSGSTGKAVMYENKEKNKNYKYIGIELNEEYLPIAKARIEYVCNLDEKQKECEMTIYDYL